MAKKFFFLLSIACLINAAPIKKFTSTVESIDKYGATHIADTYVKGDLIIHGSSHIQNVKIKKDTTIRGSAHISHAILHAFNLNGSAHLSDVTVKGESNIHGALQIDNGIFKSTVSIAGALTATNSSFMNLFIKARDITLDSCKAQTIEIDSDANTWRISIFGFCLYEKKYPSCLVLKNSIIDGDIIFKGPAGTIKMDASSVIKGRVVNGTIVKK